LLAFDARRSNTLYAGLLAFDARRSNTLYAGLLALHASSLTVDSRRRLLARSLPLGACSLAVSAGLRLVHRRLAVLAATAAMRPRTCRGCDRQCGNTCGEKHPGHHNISFRTAKTARSPRRSNTSTDGTGTLAQLDEPEMSRLFRYLSVLVSNPSGS
jgi:hypothetical protein